MLVVIELGRCVSCLRNIDAGEEVISSHIKAVRLLNEDDADINIVAPLVAAGQSGRLQPIWDSATQRLGETDEERYSQGQRNWRTDGCGRADIGGGIGRRDTRS